MFIKGYNPGTGCFFSTDFDAADLWFPISAPTTTNAMSVAMSVSTDKSRYCHKCLERGAEREYR